MSLASLLGPSPGLGRKGLTRYLRGVAIIKKAAAIVNAKNGDLDLKLSKYIIKDYSVSENTVHLAQLFVASGK